MHAHARMALSVAVPVKVKPKKVNPDLLGMPFLGGKERQL